MAITSPTSPTAVSKTEKEEEGQEEAISRWIKYTHDRPFNDHRYAVDATKLRGLGWEQKTGFEEGLRRTVEWYVRFGERWWGDISKVLTPFPVVAGREVISDHEPVSDRPLGGRSGVGNAEVKRDMGR